MSQKPNFDIWHVAIPVNDLNRSVKFYCDTLGFVLIGFDEYPSKKQAFIAVRKGAFTIELFEPKPRQKNPKYPDHLAFECPNLNEYREKLLRNNLTDIPQIEIFDNGVQYLGLQDPDGITLEFFQGRHIYEQSISRDE